MFQQALSGCTPQPGRFFQSAAIHAAASPGRFLHPGSSAAGCPRRRPRCGRRLARLRRMRKTFPAAHAHARRPSSAGPHGADAAPRRLALAKIGGCKSQLIDQRRFQGGGFRKALLRRCARRQRAQRQSARCRCWRYRAVPGRRAPREPSRRSGPETPINSSVEMPSSASALMSASTTASSWRRYSSSMGCFASFSCASSTEPHAATTETPAPGFLRA